MGRKTRSDKGKSRGPYKTHGQSDKEKIKGLKLKRLNAQRAKSGKKPIKAKV